MVNSPFGKCIESIYGRRWFSWNVFSPVTPWYELEPHYHSLTRLDGTIMSSMLVTQTAVSFPGNPWKREPGTFSSLGVVTVGKSATIWVTDECLGFS